MWKKTLMLRSILQDSNNHSKKKKKNLRVSNCGVALWNSSLSTHWVQRAQQWLKLAFRLSQETLLPLPGAPVGSLRCRTPANAALAQGDWWLNPLTGHTFKQPFLLYSNNKWYRSWNQKRKIKSVVIPLKWMWSLWKGLLAHSRSVESRGKGTYHSLG